jgi:membrane carboxypeptidase/penicillin-binding protein
MITVTGGAACSKGPAVFTESRLDEASEFFAEEARRNILDLFGEDKLYGGGLSVHATLDPSLQQIARKV